MFFHVLCKDDHSEILSIEAFSSEQLLIFSDIQIKHFCFKQSSIVQESISFLNFFFKKHFFIRMKIWYRIDSKHDDMELSAHATFSKVSVNHRSLWNAVRDFIIFLSFKNLWNLINNFFAFIRVFFPKFILSSYILNFLSRKSSTSITFVKFCSVKIILH